MDLLQEADFIALTEEQASAMAKERGYTTRVRDREGTVFMGSCDRRRDRWNLSIADGKVIRAYVG